MTQTTPERKPCGTCGNEYTVVANGTIRHHFTDNPDFQAGPDSRKCKGAGRPPATAAGITLAEDMEQQQCRLCRHPVQLTGNGRARSHLTPEATPRPCPGGSDFPLGQFPDVVGTTDGLVATLARDCEHRDVGACYDCFGAAVPTMADQLKAVETDDFGQPIRECFNCDVVGCPGCGAVPAGDERDRWQALNTEWARQRDNDTRTQAEQFKDGGLSDAELARVKAAVAAVPDTRTPEQKAADARTSELTAKAVKILEQRTPEQKAETAARMDRTASAALGVPLDPALNHTYMDSSGVKWVHDGTRETCETPECKSWRRAQTEDTETLVDPRTCPHPQGFTYDYGGKRCPDCGTVAPGDPHAYEADIAIATVEAERAEEDRQYHQTISEELARQRDAWRTPADLLAKMPEDVQALDALRLNCAGCGHPVTPLVDRFDLYGDPVIVVWGCNSMRKCCEDWCAPDKRALLGDLKVGEHFVRRGTLMRVTDTLSGDVHAAVVKGPMTGREGVLPDNYETVERAPAPRASAISPKTRSVTSSAPTTKESPVTTDQSAAAAAFLGGGRSSVPVQPAVPANQAAAAAQFLAGGSGAHGEKETKRDRYGRYLLLHPDTGKEKAWTRATTFAKSISDTYALSQWGLRMCLLGATMRPDVVRRAHGKHVKADKKLLDELTAELKTAAGDKVAANDGTAMHSFTELADRAWHSPGGPRSVMGQIPEDCRDMVETYIRLLEEMGLEPVPDLIEFTTAVKQYGVAGTSDNCYKVTKPITLKIGRAEVMLSPGEYVIGDKKTGKDLDYGWQEIAIQLALYAQGLTTAGRWDRNEEKWYPKPLGDATIRLDAGIVVHLPVDKESEKTPTVYGVDLESGWNAAVLCERVRTWRNVRSLASPALVTGEPGTTFTPVRPHASTVVKSFPRASDYDPDTGVTTRTTVHPPTLADRANAVTSKGEASAVWKEAKGQGLPEAEVAELVKTMQARLEKLAEPAG